MILIHGKDNEDENSVNWCRENDLVLNRKKATEMNIDFRTKQSKKAPILIDSQQITTTDPFKFLGTHISLKCKKPNRLYFLSLLQTQSEQGLLVQIYTAIIQSILSLSITLCYGNTSNYTVK